MLRFPRHELALFGALALVMLVTRGQSLSAVLHLPDTAYATFFVAGFGIRRPLGFVALFLLGFAIDLVVVRALGMPDFCITPAYVLLVPAYGVLWLAGRAAQAWLARSGQAFGLAVMPKLAAVVTGATLLAELLASGGFYVLSGRFADPTLAGLAQHVATYAPFAVMATLGWTGLAAASAVVVMMRQGRIAR